jgi:DNA-directed RNA polymerase subunit beta
VTYRREQAGWAVPFNGDRLKASKPDYDAGRRRDRRGAVRGGQEDHPAPLNQILEKGAVAETLAPFETIYGRFAAAT